MRQLLLGLLLLSFNMAALTFTRMRPPRLASRSLAAPLFSTPPSRNATSSSADRFSGLQSTSPASVARSDAESTVQRTRSDQRSMSSSAMAYAQIGSEASDEVLRRAARTAVESKNATMADVRALMARMTSVAPGVQSLSSVYRPLSTAAGGGRAAPTAQGGASRAAAPFDPNSHNAMTGEKRSAPRDTRSTATLAEDDTVFGVDTASQRRERLDGALRGIGFDPETLGEMVYQGTAAARHYRSFVLPKNQKALETAELPGREVTVAAQVLYAAREAEANAAEYLRNHDYAREEMAASGRGTADHPLVIVLDDLRSAANVGNIFRLAEAAGVAEVVTCGITPSPPHPTVLKTALGCAERVQHRRFTGATEAIEALRGEGFEVWAAETTSRSVSYADMAATREDGSAKKIALVLGNELVGVRVGAMEDADHIVSVPTFGVKNSLNVATAASVLVFDVLRQWGSCNSDAP